MAVAKYLVAVGANTEATDCDGWTPLHLAAENSCLELVCFLIEAGANKDAVTERHALTPLHLAADHGALQMVRYLVTAGAKRNAKNIEGRTPKDLAASIANWDVVRVLDEPDVDHPLSSRKCVLGMLENSND